MPTLSPARAHLRPPPLHTTLRALVRSSLTGGACCARAQGTATVRKTKVRQVRRLQARIVAAANAAPKRLHRLPEEPPGPEQATPPPPCDLGPGPHHARRGGGPGSEDTGKEKEDGAFQCSGQGGRSRRAFGMEEGPAGYRRAPQDGSRRSP